MLQENQKRLLKKQIALFNSSYEGEVLAAVNAANRTLKSANLGWIDIAENINNESNQDSTYEAYQAGWAAGYNHGLNHRVQPENHFDEDKYHEMLVALEKHNDKLNQWSRAFVSNLLQNWFHNGTEKRLSQKQCAVIDRMFKQFCGV